MIEVLTINNDMVFSNMYILKENNHIIVIDPCVYDIDLEDAVLDYILLTHEHYDHISGVNYLKEKYNCDVICSNVCANNIQNSRKNLSSFFKAFCELQTMIKIEHPIDDVVYECSADITFDETTCFEWQGNKIEMISTPGHSLGSSCIIVNKNMLFSGDSLFKSYPTVTGIPGGSKKKWLNKTLPFLRSLPKNMTVYPGHFEEFLLSDYMFWEEYDG